ncbi:myosin heavy chain, cardiac muscle isoform-like isoform X2 [Stegodyphus dumicola]|uniref:myosin heavy chain, cardiac muscle isoform-like isoform X2 n=1 Tax=Stegodyphus dumicola TaxID=202533 RepID=UPI0015AFF466|nr:myosin heavy chain, cardiac muscle isoform-like isoform X2 [Stegodyphus dumicola]
MVGTTFVAETFTKSVLQCFCRTCQVPNVATEVRCSEQSKGGLKYELVLAEPTLDSPKAVSQTPPKSNISIEDIEKKLRAAEERRQSIELQKINLVTEKLNHLETVKVKKEEVNHNFMQSAKENLEQKLECMKENRETHIKNIQEKAREIVQKVDEKRKAGDSPDREEKLEAINKKLVVAQEQREALLASLQERLKEHDKHILEVKKQMEEQTENLREKSIKKLEIAQAKREALMKEIQEKIKEHKAHILRVRQMNELNQQEGGDKLQQIHKKLCTAELKRSEQIQAMLEKLQEHERHVVQVRQKALSVSNDENCKENIEAFSG